MMVAEHITRDFPAICPLPPGRHSARALKGELALPFPSPAPVAAVRMRSQRPLVRRDAGRPEQS